MCRFVIMITLLVPFLSKSYAQETVPHAVPVTLFYDEGWQVTTKQKGVFSRVATLDTVAFKFVNTVTDYYANGAPLLQANYGPNGKEGSFQLMYSNGKVERKGVFLNDKPAGKWTFFYADGSPFQTIEYLPNEDFRVLSFFDSTGQQLVKDGTGPWHSELLAQVGGDNIPLIITGLWKDSLKVGTWTATQTNGKKVYEEEFEAGKLKKGKLFDLSGKRVVETYKERENAKLATMEFIRHAESFLVSDRFLTKERAKDYILRKEYLLPPTQASLANTEATEKMPEFPGGQEGMYKFLMKEFRVPSDVLRMGIDGTVVVTIVVAATGEVKEPTIIKSLHPSIDKEVLRVISRMPLWKPGTSNGVPANVKYTIPYRLSVK